jgi:hypothetical protein
VGAHVEDLVDAYFGPDVLRERALEGAPHDPQALRDEALALLEETPGSGLEDDRVRWLLGQLRGLECVTARLAGEEIAWSDEVERCFGVRPVHVDEDVFRASHGRLDAALPGSGDLRTRYNAWLDATNVPNEAIPRVLEVLHRELRRRAAGIVELPPGEHLDYETLRGEPWQAFNEYHGDLHSLVQVNLDLPRSIVDVVDIVAHEAYPGHHTERACKEQLLYRDRGRLETCVTIASAPEAMITEGIATNALEVAVRDDGFGALLGAVEGLGFPVDAEPAEVVHVESWLLFAAATNVSRMLHEDGMARADAEDYLRAWALDSDERAAKTVAFLTDPGSRTYTTAYTDGRRLCRAFVDGSPDAFRRLLTEQLTVSSLLGADA